MGSIKDKTAIMGVGCTKFGELWEKDAEDLIVEAAYEAMDDAGITPDDIEATWVANLYDFTGLSGSDQSSIVNHQSSIVNHQSSH